MDTPKTQYVPREGVQNPYRDSPYNPRVDVDRDLIARDYRATALPSDRCAHPHVSPTRHCDGCGEYVPDPLRGYSRPF